MTTPDIPPYSGPWDARRIEQYRNMALLEQPPVLDGVREISQDPDLFSIWMEAHDLSDGPKRAPAGTPYTSTAVALLVQSRTYLGMGESPANTNAITREYNTRYHIGTVSFAWCDASVSLAAVHSNNEMPVLGGHGKGYAYVPAHAAWFQSIGRLHWGMPTAPGQVVFFRWDRKKKTTMCDHVGIVESVNTADHTITVLEGNSADKFRRVVRDAAYVVGYGDPDFIPPDPNQFPGRFLQLKTKMMHGADVAWVQNHLNTKLDPDITVDGWYGKDTKADVIRFQKAAKLKDVDGIVGPATWNALVA